MGLTPDFVAGALGGTWSQGDVAAFPGVSIDTRSLQTGELFVAVVGERDGHDFIPQALAKGCGGILTSRPLPHVAVPWLLVADTVQALGTLARAWREKVDPLVIAVTGSSGKTTVKEMIKGCLAHGGRRVHATRGNLNNHLGVPLTLLAMPQGCDTLVVEMGMNAPGEIAHLCTLARPRIGVITNVHPAHIGAFASLEGIAQAKGELLRALPADGVAVIEGDGKFFLLLSQISVAPCLTFGKGAQVRLSDLVMDHGGTSFDMAVSSPVVGSGTGGRVYLPLAGEHMAQNALAAAAVCLAAGLDLAAIAAGLAAAGDLPAGRGRVLAGKGGVTLIDDSYNANPGSMAAALRMLAGTTADARQRVAILGDMFELGEAGPGLHGELAQVVVESGIHRLFLCGPLMKNLCAALPEEVKERCLWREKTVDWFGGVASHLAAGDRVLVKGSRGMAMERIIQDLQAGKGHDAL